MSQVDFILYAPVGRPDDPDRLTVVESVKCKQLIAQIKEDLEPLLENYLFELNTALTRACVVDSVARYLRHTDSYAFRVVCDETNNPPETIANHQLNVDLFVQPNPVPEWINLNVVLAGYPFFSPDVFP